MQRHKHKSVRRVDELNCKKIEGADGGEAFLRKYFLTSSIRIPRKHQEVGFRSKYDGLCVCVCVCVHFPTSNVV
jgi:hypothetical protein